MWQIQCRGRHHQHLAWRSSYLKNECQGTAELWIHTPLAVHWLCPFQRVIRLLCHCQWTMAPTHFLKTPCDVVHRLWLSLSSSWTLKSMSVLQKNRCYPENSKVVELPHTYNAFSFTLIFPWRMQSMPSYISFWTESLFVMYLILQNFFFFLI